jgi:hypothetical protein
MKKLRDEEYGEFIGTVPSALFLILFYSGREGVKFAIEEMTELKLVVWNRNL